MKQSDQILEHLRKGEVITPLDALNLFGCFRLAARIDELRRLNWDIKTTKVTKNGKTYAEYSMPSSSSDCYKTQMTMFPNDNHFTAALGFCAK